jgi:hypothetical protein
VVVAIHGAFCRAEGMLYTLKKRGHNCISPYFKAKLDTGNTSATFRHCTLQLGLFEGHTR